MRTVGAVLIALMLSGCVLDRIWARDEKGLSTHERLTRLGLLKPGDAPAEEQYKYHFSFWKSCISDLVEQLQEGGYLDDQRVNHRRVLKSAVETQKHLQILRQFLLSDKQEELDPHLEIMSQAVDQLATRPRETQLRRLSRILAREQRTVDRQFRYSRVQSSINQAGYLRTDAYEDTEDPPEAGKAP